MSTQGFSTPLTFDGLALVNLPTDAFEIQEAEQKGNLVCTDGSLREQRPSLAPGAPEVRTRYAFTLEVSNLGPYQAQVEARLAFAGPHLLAAWKHVSLGWRGDGSRLEWLLPWRLAPHLLAPPPGYAIAGRFDPEVRIGFDGPPLVAQTVSTLTYESDTPGDGEVFFELQGTRFKLSEPIAAGTRLTARVVPLFPVVTAQESQSRRFNGPFREPRRLALVEA